jgi:CBS domain-containing protein
VGKLRLGSKPPLTVDIEDSVLSVARAITARGVGAATVLAGAGVAGVVTERDVLRKVVAAGLDPATTPVSAIMSKPAITIGVGATVDEAAALMRKHHIRHLVVLDDQGRQAGMLALRYLLYEMMDDMQRNVGDLVGYIMMDSPGG